MTETPVSTNLTAMQKVSWEDSRPPLGLGDPVCACGHGRSLHKAPRGLDPCSGCTGRQAAGANALGKVWCSGFRAQLAVPV